MSSATDLAETKHAGEDGSTLEAPPAEPQPQRPQPPLSTKTSRSLSASTDGLVLFDLTNEVGGTLAFSPHCMKSIIDLKLLGVGYERQRLSFVQVRRDLEKRIGQGVTVPSLELSDGSHLTDSWKIAEYLEAKHPRGFLLFPNSAVKSYAASLNEFGKLLAPHIGALTIPQIAQKLDEPSREYFIDSKIGQARFGRLSGLGEEEKEGHVQSAKKMLGIVESSLACEAAKADAGSVQSGGNRWLAGTELPSHADACLFGWYCYTRSAGDAATREIWFEHEHLKKWVKDMIQWCGPEITNDLI
ncbi:hypothetical protein BCV69DRAFT_270501 [Microstroma glucosiphilum]|uniref:Uncharacterized protein n=1 Tax=Pseudomicrostroma glucosiphilum TaxID=1684307 RepID=A0A316U6B0_9BASI|nr:hypothetical protein BCV69DRAFT_270501 [Pseudomicrostroma glucosiphilum]PWN20797.1 hypothetical protein BCV69DRAFT_270501 [Pseudomicrostroma glucosiphilum]